MPNSPIPAHLDSLLRDIEQEVGEQAIGAWAGFTNSRDHVLLVVFPTECRVAWSRKGQQVWRRDDVLVSTSSDGRSHVVLIEPSSGKGSRFFATSREVLDEVDAALAVRGDGSASVLVPIGADRVVTLPDLPGHRIERVHGVVSGIASLSGWTAEAKGRGAMEKAFPELLASAARQGANAVVGVQATTFGAAGGVTNMLGGDAVGVLLVGTAVTAVPETPPGGSTAH